MRPRLTVLLLVLMAMIVPSHAAHSAPLHQYPVLPECRDDDPTLTLCIVVTDFDPAQLATYTDAVTLDGDEFTFVYEDMDADLVLLSGGMSTLIYPVPRSDYWAIRLRVQQASAATFSYQFVPIKGNRPQTPRRAAEVWRGADAPPPPPTSDPLQGSIETVELDSVALGTSRTVEVYRPPNHDPAVPTRVLYMSDGYFVTDFAAVVEARILAGELPPVLLVGAYPGIDPARRRDVRAEEYLPGYEQAVFDRHADFFLNELITWAETTYGASPRREDRAVFGLSNGAAFSSWMGVNHAEIFGAAIVFSQAWTVEFVPPAEPIRVYLQVGTLEPTFYRESNRWREILAEAGIELTYHERVAGHELIQWQEEIGHALVWVFGETDQ